MSVVSGNALQSLVQNAQAKSRLPGAYGGEVLPVEVHDFLNQHGGVLVDVRTVPEWQAGAPPGATFISWKTAPDMALNPDFMEELRKAVPDAQTPIFFLCRGGSRSLDAAIQATQAGYAHCFNITHGFEGSSLQRGANGWKADGLPWVQP